MADIGQMTVAIIGDTSQFNGAIDAAQQKFRTMGTTIAQSAVSVAQSFKQIDGEAAVWGRSVDLIAQKQQVLKNEISSLIAQGIDPLDARIEHLQAEYFKLGKEAEDLAKKQKSFADNMTDLGAKAGRTGLILSMAITAPLVGMATAALRSTATMEMLQASFQTMLGSAEKAAVLMTALKKMAAVTPFETTDLAQASKTLLQFGVTNEQLIPTLKMLGDVAGGNAGKFNSLALVFGQISSLGRLQGQDLLQLINVGYNPLQDIAKKTGETMAQLKERMSEGGIGTEEVTEAFKAATSAGGKFFNGMETASKTLDGLTSTLRDDVATLGRSFVEEFLPFIKETVKWLSSVAQNMSTMDDRTKSLTIGISITAAAIGPLLLMVSGMAKAIVAVDVAMKLLNMTTKVSPWGIVLTAVGLIAAGLGIWATNAASAAAEQDKLNTSNDTFLQSMKDIQAQEDRKKQISHLDKEAGIALEYGSLLMEQKALKATIAKYANNQGIQATLKEEARLKVVQKRIDELTAYQALLDNIEAERIEAEEAIATAPGNAAVAASLASLDEYKAKMEEINRLQDAGRITEEEANKSRLDLTSNYIDALVKAGSVVDDSIKKSEEKYATLVEMADAEKSAAAAVEAAAAATQKGNKESRDAVRLNEYLAKSIDSVTLATDGEAYSIKTATDLFADFDKKIAELQTLEDLRIAAAETATDMLGYFADFGDSMTMMIEGDTEEAVNSFIDMGQGILVAMGPEGALASGIVEGVQTIVDLITSIADAEEEAIAAALEREQERAATMLDLEDQILQAKIDNIDTALDIALDAIDEEEEAAIAAAEAMGATDEALAQIRQLYIDKELEAEEAAADQKAELERDMAILDRDIAVAKLEIARAEAAATATQMGGKDSEILALYDSLIAMVKATPIPNLASGGIVMPSVGGTLTRVAEAEQPEVIFPLTELERFLSGGSTGEVDTGDIHLVVNLDSKPFLDKIFPATRNRTVLVSAGAVV